MAAHFGLAFVLSCRCGALRLSVDGGHQNTEPAVNESGWHWGLPPSHTSPILHCAGPYVLLDSFKPSALPASPTMNTDTLTVGALDRTILPFSGGSMS